MKKINIIFLLNLCVSSLFAQTVDQKLSYRELCIKIENQFNISVNISLSKSAYVIGENIPLVVEVINHSDVAPPITEHIWEYIHVNDETGKRAKTEWFIHSSAPSMYDTSKGMKINEIKKFEFDLKWHYGSKMLPDGTTGFLKGVYEVYFNQELLETQLSSNIISFEVIEPGPDEIVAYNLYINGRQLQKSKKNDQALKIYEQLINQCPESKYTGLALQEKLFLYKWVKPNLEERCKVGKMILEKHNDMGYNERAIRDIIKYYKNINNVGEAKLYFERLKEDIGNAELERRLESMIEEIK